jgi:DNA-binding beta-propeller fold protein YncE
MKSFWLFLVLLFLNSTCILFAQNKKTVLTVPGYNELSKIDTAYTSILPSGRYISPVGTTLRITHDPFGLAVAPDNSIAISLHENVFTIIDLKSQKPIRVPDYKKDAENPLKNGSFLGVAFHPTEKIVYLSGGDEGTVIVYDYEHFKKIDSIKIDGIFNHTQYEGSFTSDLAYLEKTNELLILDRGNFRMVKYDLNLKKITASIETGRYLLV